MGITRRPVVKKMKRILNPISARPISNAPHQQKKLWSSASNAPLLCDFTGNQFRSKGPCDVSRVMKQKVAQWLVKFRVNPRVKTVKMLSNSRIQNDFGGETPEA